MPQAARVCIVIPGSGNEFNNGTGNRIAEALRSLDVSVQVVTPRTWRDEGTMSDLGLFVGLGDIVFAHGEGEAAGLARLRQILAKCRRAANWLLEPVGTRWFDHAAELTHKLGIELFDYSLHPQTPPTRCRYRHINYGLTRRERESIPATWNPSRPIPWCVVGHATPDRVRLVARLTRGYSPSGFAYLPHLSPVTEDGPHLSDRQMQSVLERSRLHVWCAHFTGFYLEAERFRRALLAGCVPVKVVASLRDDVPFSYLLAPESTLESWLAVADLPALWQRFHADYLTIPTLETELAAILGLPLSTRSACQAA